MSDAGYDWWSTLMPRADGLSDSLDFAEFLVGIQTSLRRNNGEQTVEILQRRRAVRSWEASTRFGISDLDDIVAWGTAQAGEVTAIRAMALGFVESANGVYEWRSGTFQLVNPWDPGWDCRRWLRQPTFASAAAIIHFLLPCPLTSDTQYVKGLMVAGALAHLCWLRATEQGFSGCLFEGLYLDRLLSTKIALSNEIVGIALALGFSEGGLRENSR